MSADKNLTNQESFFFVESASAAEVCRTNALFD